jgi:hypothetical protein
VGKGLFFQGSHPFNPFPESGDSNPLIAEHLREAPRVLPGLWDSSSTFPRGRSVVPGIELHINLRLYPTPPTSGSKIVVAQAEELALLILPNKPLFITFYGLLFTPFLYRSPW